LFWLEVDDAERIRELGVRRGIAHEDCACSIDALLEAIRRVHGLVARR
jgi:hypothetical protein